MVSRLIAGPAGPWRRAALLALLSVIAADPSSVAAASDFVIADSPDSTRSLEPAFAPIPSPWSDPAFQARFPDIGFIREATVSGWPSTAHGEGEAGHFVGRSRGGALNARDLAAGMRPPKFTIRVSPGF